MQKSVHNKGRVAETRNVGENDRESLKTKLKTLPGMLLEKELFDHNRVSRIEQATPTIASLQ